MIFQELDLTGCYVIHVEPHEDDRGFFARTFEADEFRARGLESAVAQCSISHNRAAGTLRGLHYQSAPHEETKVVRCVRGHVFDVLVDVRRDSPTYLEWRTVDLSAENGRAVYVPSGVAHGFLTLVDDSDLVYQMSVRHEPAASSGLAWDDPALGIQWPNTPTLLSARDAQWPRLSGLLDD